MIQPPRRTRESGVSLVLRGAAVTVVLGGLAALGGVLAAGAPAGYGVLVGTGLVAVVCTGGALVVVAVTHVAPAASLLVAMLTYVLQVVVLLLAFVLLERSGLLESGLDRQWLGGAVIGATMVWLASQVVTTIRARVPAYDLAPEAGER